MSRNSESSGSFAGSLPVPLMVVCPPGTEELYDTDQVIVHHIVDVLEVFADLDTSSRFEIFDAAGNRMYYACEVSNCCFRYCCGLKRPFTIHVMNEDGNISLTVKRRYTFCMCLCTARLCSYVELYSANSEIIGKVKQKCCDYCTGKFFIEDANGQKCLNIIAPTRSCCHSSDACFQVTNLEGEQVGEIRNKWSGLVKELISTADTFGVSFPVDMNPGLKTLLLGAVFLIDFMYYEKARCKKKER